MAGTGWFESMGSAGEVPIRDLVGDEALRNRALSTENVVAIPLAEFALAGRDVRAEVGHRAYLLRDRDRVVVRLETPTQGGRSWSGELAGDDLAMTYERVDLPRVPGSKVEQVLYLQVRAGQRAWVAHFLGGRMAGERLVLSRGDRPHAGAPVVTCLPAARSRSLPPTRLRRRQPADTHLVRWEADATAAEVALAAMIVLSGRHAGIDYLGASFVGAAREIAGIWRVFTPTPDPLPTRPEST